MASVVSILDWQNDGRRISSVINENKSPAPPRESSGDSQNYFLLAFGKVELVWYIL